MLIFQSSNFSNSSVEFFSGFGNGFDKIPKTESFVVEQFFGAYQCFSTHIHGGKFSSIVWSGSTMSLWKILHVNFHRAYETRIKVFLEVQIASASDGRLINSALLENKRSDEEISKSLATIKTKEQCEQLKVLLALDFWFLNGSDYT